MFKVRIIKYLGNQLYWDQLYAKSMGTEQTNVNGKVLTNLVFPLPPLAEQHRIVAKIEALCDSQNVRLVESQTTQLQLADATVEQVVA